MKARARSILATAVVVALAACTGAQDAPTPPAPPDTAALAIGVFPEQNIFRQLQRYEPVGDYLGRRAGVRIRLVALPRYGDVVDRFQAEQLDGAFFGSFSYALAHARLGVEAVARPEAPDGTSTYRGLVFVRRDGGVRGALDLRGKRFAFVDKATTAGYLLPLEFLAEAGITDYQHFLGEAYFAGTHEAAIRDVLDRRADAGAAKNTIFERMAREDARIRQELVVLRDSPAVPENALGLRPGLDPKLVRSLTEALLAMDRDEEGRAVLQQFGARRFIPTTDAEYEPVYRYARQVGLQLGFKAAEEQPHEPPR